MGYETWNGSGLRITWNSAGMILAAASSNQRVKPWMGLLEGRCDKHSYGRNSHVPSRNDGAPNQAQTDRRCSEPRTLTARTDNIRGFGTRLDDMSRQAATPAATLSAVWKTIPIKKLVTVRRKPSRKGSN